jgi:hypothetical protein
VRVGIVDESAAMSTSVQHLAMRRATPYELADPTWPLIAQAIQLREARESSWARRG